MIEALILSALVSNRALTKQLATYADKPAIFFQLAPNDQDVGWNALQFPRMDYTLDWQYSPERNTAGSLMLNVWCLNNGLQIPETIGMEIRAALQDLFLTEDGNTYALAWERTDVFEAGGGSDPTVIGATLSFDLLAFPIQYTTIPDPIEGLSLWLNAVIPTAKVIGVDAFPSLVRATGDAPVLYVRMQTDGSNMKNSYAVAWMTANMAVHIFSPDTMRRQFLCRNITNALAIEGEICLTDQSQMLIRKTAMITGNNPLQQGQLAVTGEYGVLRKTPSQLLMINPHFERNLAYGSKKG